MKGGNPILVGLRPFFSPLFTRVRGRWILRSSSVGGSKKFAGPSVAVSYACGVKEITGEGAMMDRERPSASDTEGRIPEAWIGKRVMIETTEALSTDLRAAVPVCLEDVNERGIVVSETIHHDRDHPHRYFYPWGVVGRMRPAEEGEQEGSEGRRDR